MGTGARRIFFGGERLARCCLGAALLPQRADFMIGTRHYGGASPGYACISIPDMRGLFFRALSIHAVRRPDDQPACPPLTHSYLPFLRLGDGPR